MCMGTEAVSPAASQPTEVSERGYLETPSAGDSVAQNAEAVKRETKNGSQADTKSQGVYPIKAATISIKDFFGIVNSTNQSILPGGVLEKMGAKRAEDGPIGQRILRILTASTMKPRSRLCKAMLER